MSGMEGIVALGIAGNVVQFIDFGAKLCSRIEEYSAAAGVPKMLQDTWGLGSAWAVPGEAATRAWRRIRNSKLHSRPVSKATELSALLDTFIDKDQARNSTWRNTTIAWKSLRAEKKVSELQKTLEGLLKPLNLNLQAKIA